MLNHIDYTNNNKTTYKCDRCGALVLKAQIKGIGVTNEKHNMIKKWDLCLNCYNTFEKAIVKRLKNE